MMEIGVVRLMVAIGIGFTLGAGIVGYYADRAVRALRAELNFMRRVVDTEIRAKGRV
jgi:hypothetical protein